MSFADSSFAARLGAMGDQAESVFEDLFPKHHRNGLNRPDMQVSQLTLKQRNTPDYLCQDGYVEVMGIGRDSTLKLKLDKAVALCQWNADSLVDLFVWDSYRRRWWKGPILDWFAAAVRHGEIAEFHDSNRPHFRLKAKDFPFAATKRDAT